MKKIISIITAAVLLAVMPLGVFAKAEVGATVVASAESAKPGETITFTLEVENSSSVYAVMVMPEFNKELFTLVGGEWLCDGMIADFSLETGDGVITWAEAKDINGSLFRFTLKVKDDLTESVVASVGCGITVMDKSDVRVEYPKAKTASVSLNVKEPDPTPIGLRGDVNKNGSIDSRDYVTLKRAYFKTARLDEISVKLADVNNNGALDSRDYVTLKRVYFKTAKIKDEIKYVY